MQVYTCCVPRVVFRVSQRNLLLRSSRQFAKPAEAKQDDAKHAKTKRELSEAEKKKLASHVDAQKQAGKDSQREQQIAVLQHAMRRQKRPDTRTLEQKKKDNLFMRQYSRMKM